MHSFTHSQMERASWAAERAPQFSLISSEATHICIPSVFPPRRHSRDHSLPLQSWQLRVSLFNLLKNTYGSVTWDNGGMSEFLREMDWLVGRCLVKLLSWKTAGKQKKCLVHVYTQTAASSAMPGTNLNTWLYVEVLSKSNSPWRSVKSLQQNERNSVQV